MPIFVARQWIRHRTASVNEVSLRYSKATSDYYLPKMEQIKEQSKNNKQGRGENIAPEKAVDIYLLLQASLCNSYKDYEDIVNRGLAREISRIVLPVAFYTEWYWKIDLHNLFHFLKLRLDAHAQYEIRVYAQAISKIVKEIVPVSYEAFEDYVLNARTFSAQEMKLLKKIIILKNFTPATMD